MLRITLLCCSLAFPVCAQELITLRSGNGTAGGPDASIVVLQGPFFAPFTVVEYAAASAGVPAEIIPSGSFGWAPTLSNDPLALWIATSQAGTGPPSLYAMPFNVTTAMITQATISINMHVDDFLGDGINSGIAVNAVPIPNTTTVAGGTWVNEVGYSNLDITGLVAAGANYLYLYVNNTGVTGAGGIQFTATIAVYPPPEYQTNSFAAGLNVNGVIGTQYMPATPTVPIGTMATLTLVSTGAGQPWDLGTGAAPLVPTSAGAVTSSDGQIVNLDLADPTLSLWFNFLQGPTFPPAILMSIPFSIPFATSISAQMIIVNPSMSSGIALSQATRLIIQ